MTRFEAALADLISPRVEGFYSAPKPSDPGGETIYGISKTGFPAWAGWNIVAQARAHPDFPECLRGEPELMREVKLLYLHEFWQKSRCEELPEPVGERLFNIAVNAGIRRAAEMLQIALAGLDRIDVAVDGQIGPATLEAVREVGSARLYDALQCVQGGFYLGLAVARSALAPNLPGWLRRALTSAPGTEDEP